MSSLRILVVDDDVVDRMAVQRALRRAPLGAELTVDEADSAEEALARLADSDADCVLLDLRLPGTNGLEVLAEMRARGHRSPVVMLTGQGDEQTAVEAMKAGAADYLTKASLDPERLARSILHAVRVRAAEHAAEIAREQVAAAEQRYRFLADSIPQMVWVATPSGVIEYVNRQWVEFTGLEAPAMQNDAWLAVIHPDDRDETQARWQEARARGTRFELQVRMRRKRDGVHRWHLSRAEALTLTDGTVRWFGTSTDIEDQKRAEAELVRLNAVAEAERRRAEESNSAKDQFLAVLSHELRTPLNSILGWISILRSSQVTPETLSRGLATIDRNARTQTQLIEDLLDVSRIVTGKLAIERKAVDVRDVASAALETVQPLAQAKRIVFVTSFAPEPLVVEGDAGRLQQVVWNLLVNAVKFTPEGGRVALAASREGEDVVVRVTDSGEGIDAAFLPHVFDRFRQADASFARTQGGLGLGLSIVHHIVERHGGKVVAASSGRGRGASFSVSLPARPDASLPSERFFPEANEDALRGIDILVVDDDDDSRDMLLAALERRGAVTRGASSVANARVELTARLPDVIVSDLGMPDEDGYALIAELRNKSPEAGGDIPTIALTGYAGLDDQRRARAAGFDQHISKPVDLSKLPQIIARLLAASSARSGAARPRTDSPANGG